MADDASATDVSEQASAELEDSSADDPPPSPLQPPVESSEQSLLTIRPHPALESSEVLLGIFNTLDFRTLLMVRNVNKVWNNEACAILKESSFAHLCGKSEESVEEANELIDSAAKDQRSTPFRNFFVYFKDVPTEGLQKILDRPSTIVYGLNYHTEGASNGIVSEKREFLRQFLARYGQNTVHIIYVFDSELDFDDLDDVPDESSDVPRTAFHLPVLKTFEYWERDIVSAAESVDFLAEILYQSPQLNKIATNTHHTNIYDGLHRHHFFENMEDLHLIDCRLRTLTTIFALPMTHLRSLALQIWQNTSSRMTSTTFIGVTRRIYNTIEQLSVSYIDFTLIGIQMIPQCPLLRDFLLHDWHGSFSLFNVDKMPNLRRLFVSDYAMDMVNHVHFLNDPHPGVTSFTCRESGLDRIRQGEYFASLLDYIPQKFPNLNSLGVIVDSFPTKVLHAVLRNYGQIECLEIQKFSASSDAISVESMEDFFTGYNRYTLERVVRGNQDLSRITRGPCLLDLPHLKKLTILQNGQGIILTNNAIQYGVALMPNLKCFQFDMNPLLSLDVVQDHLTHLEEIVVKMDVKSMEEAFDEDTVGDFEDMLATLCASMRQVIVDHSALSPLDKFDLRNY